jgi:hypothetical protein
MRVVKAAAVQLSPVLYSREGTVEKVAEDPRAWPTGGAVRHVPGDRGAVLPVLLVHPARPPASTESGPDFLPYTMLEGASYGKTR